MSKVLGIDPSLTATGIALLQLGAYPGPTSWEHLGVLRTKLRGHDRLAYITLGVREQLMQLSDGDLVVMEGPSYGSQGSRSHELAGIWWLINHEIWKAQAHVGQLHTAIVAPRSRAKYATGNGNSAKPEVLQMTRERYPYLTIVDDNVADAITLAAIGARYLNSPTDNPAPQALEALAKVSWSSGI